MREPLKLEEQAIVAALQTQYGLSVSSLSFLPLGSDSASAAYRVDADDAATYFLKVRTAEGFSVASLAVPHYLYGQGVTNIVAPLPAIAQTLWVSVDGFALSLYPFIHGGIGAHVGLTKQQWRTMGAMTKRIHASQLTPELLQIVRREAYVPSRRDVLTRVASAIAQRDLADPVQRELGAFWHSRQEEIRTLVDRADTLGRRLRQASLPPVLCHADLHTWNVLLDEAQRLWLVDWDETVLAPQERDLMFVVGGIGRDLVGPEETSCFFQGYGKTALDPQALVYYRYAWAVQDMGAYGERILFAPDLGEETRRDALHSIMGLFEPGNIAAIAFASDSA